MITIKHWCSDTGKMEIVVSSGDEEVERLRQLCDAMNDCDHGTHSIYYLSVDPPYIMFDN